MIALVRRHPVQRKYLEFRRIRAHARRRAALLRNPASPEGRRHPNGPHATVAGRQLAPIPLPMGGNEGK